MMSMMSRDDVHREAQGIERNDIVTLAANGAQFVAIGVSESEEAGIQKTVHLRRMDLDGDDLRLAVRSDGAVGYKAGIDRDMRWSTVTTDVTWISVEPSDTPADQVIEYDKPETRGYAV